MIIIRLLIDADGCPVMDITLRICGKYHIPCLILCDTAHQFHRENAETLVICAKVEEELSTMPAEDKEMFLESYGIEESGLSRLVK